MLFLLYLLYRVLNSPRRGTIVPPKNLHCLMSAVTLMPTRAADIESIVQLNWLNNVMTFPEDPLSEIVLFLYRCVISKVRRSGFPNSNAHKFPLGKISNTPSNVTPPTSMFPIHLPSEGTNTPFTMRRMRLDCFGFESLCFTMAKALESIALMDAPSSNTPRKRTTLPFSPLSATPWMNGSLSPSRHFPDSVANV